MSAQRRETVRRRIEWRVPVANPSGIPGYTPEWPEVEKAITEAEKELRAHGVIGPEQSGRSKTCVFRGEGEVLVFIEIEERP